MVFTNYGKQAVAWAIGSDIPNNYISYFAVGSGSGTEAVTNVTLVNEFKRFPITGSPDFTTDRKVIFQGDLSSISASGLILKEWAMLASGTALTGSVWQREQLTGSLVFDGTLELSIENAIEVV